METDYDNGDLPLLANVNEVMVEHYILILKCNFARKCFMDNIAYLYLTPIDANGSNFRIILDCKDLIIKAVEEIEVNEEFSTPETDHNVISKLSTCPTEPLQFEAQPWCIRAWKTCEKKVPFPKIICIRYDTSPNGASLTWCKDQAEKDCCYTYGAWINNRSLFPCQEPPTALASWQAYVTVPLDATVVLSGDRESTEIEQSSTTKTYYNYASTKLPMATFALAVGFWKCYSDLIPAKLPASNLYVPDGLFNDSQIADLGKNLDRVSREAQNVLGKYPFPRLDVLVLPRNYDSLGLASPNVMFLSQSVVKDGSETMLGVRLAHEMAHGWFGLLIGAKDWTEEWLSEGFATFVEDIIYVKTTNWTKTYIKNWMEIRLYLRYLNLMSELNEEVNEDLQTLRPNKGQIESHRVKNGLNPDKGFMQVHYLKGYFLLHHLSQLAAEDQFLIVLKKYVEIYNGQLVTSQELFEFFLTSFPHLCSKGMTVESLCTDWLDSKQLPMSVKGCTPSSTNTLYSDVVTRVKWWRQFNAMKRQKRRKIGMDCVLSTHEFCSEQVILLLEMLLSEKRLTNSTLDHLKLIYKLDQANAEVRHRWCELIIKHGYTQEFSAIKRFLLEDQGMGVYLYGELMVSEKKVLQKLAMECWAQVENESSYSASKVIKEMLGIL